MKRYAAWWAGIVLIVAVLLIALFLSPRGRLFQEFIGMQTKGKKTVADRLEEFGSLVDQRLAPLFAQQQVQYPPQQLTFITLKQEKRFEIYARNTGEKARKICSYPILAASGNLGPKLREGDRQVPEGLYAIEALNPNSLFHLSLRLNYPNAFDLDMARRENRANPGSDIMIHGNEVSIGCVALGDTAAEDVFVLAARTGIASIQVIMSPYDFRAGAQPALPGDLPPWTTELHQRIRQELLAYE
jgi:murein L,D-transpeptidase YafK